MLKVHFQSAMKFEMICLYLDRLRNNFLGIVNKMEHSVVITFTLKTLLKIQCGYQFNGLDWSLLVKHLEFEELCTSCCVYLQIQCGYVECACKHVVYRSKKKK